MGKNLVKSSKKNKGGFTLIEILVVLAILAILMTISFVYIGNQGMRARLTTATSSVKSAMTIATTCHVMGGDISDPGESRNGGDEFICSGVLQVANTHWPKLPENCSYCGKEDTKIMFQCSKEGTCSGVKSSYSYCDFESNQCEQI